MSSFRRLDRCRICQSRDLRTFLSLGETPLANSFVPLERAVDREPRFPLEVARCGECGLVQLTVVVDPEIMFRDYLYASSASAPLLEHFDRLAAEISERFAPAGAFAVELGSNDGVLLRSLNARGITALGVEPATNLAQVANAAGLATLNDFFDPRVAERIREERGPAGVVVGNNVLAHIDDLSGLVRALDVLLDEDGVFIAEVPYLADLLDQVEYDTIYHEHLSYFHLAPLRRLFAQADLALFDVVRLPIHGGSIRIHVARRGRREESTRLSELYTLEAHDQLATDAPFAGFAARVCRQREELTALLGDLRSKGLRIAGYGATAKGNTMLSYCGVDHSVLEYIVDTTPYKQGLLTPGTRIPVQPESILHDSPPDVLLLLAWNYAESIIRGHQGFISRGGRFIHPVPTPRLIPELT